MDYYKILGVTETASAPEIKTAYRALSRQYHPDLNGDDVSAEEQFKIINEAHSVLSDPPQRAAYDAQRRGPQPLDLGSIGFEGLFEQFFGSKRKPRPNPSARHTQSEKHINFKIPLSHLKKENQLSTIITIREEVVCKECRGVGGEEVTTCAPCDGHGIMQEIKKGMNIFVTSSRPCGTCFGSGRHITSPCTSCHGKGTGLEDTQYKLKIECEEV